MRDDTQEPIFSAKGWAAIAVMGCLCAAILFSMDPEWVAWAAPLAFGGALYAPGPAPASVQLWSPSDVLPVACLFSVGSLLALVLLAETPRFSWLRRLKQRFHRGGIVPLQSHGRPKSASSH